MRNRWQIRLAIMGCRGPEKVTQECGEESIVSFREIRRGAKARGDPAVGIGGDRALDFSQDADKHSGPESKG
jgi:hypothetical protein